jgi:2-iminobutanoate/2-iminopropanoate deaminase
MPRKAITAPNAVSIGPYSLGVESGDFVFLSGQTPLDPKTGELVSDSITDQAKQCFKNLFAALASAGLGPDAVVKVNVYLADMGDFKAMNQVYARQFEQPYPARTTIGVASLPMDAKIEIEMIAHIG